MLYIILLCRCDGLGGGIRPMLASQENGKLCEMNFTRDYRTVKTEHTHGSGRDRRRDRSTMNEMVTMWTGLAQSLSHMDSRG